MADKKISALTALAQGDVVVSTDVLPIVDTSATETKKIAVNALVGAAAAAGLTNVDINSGTIDGTTIATSDITVGSGKTLNVSAGTLTLADNQISGDKVEGGTINAITINTLTSTAVNATTVDATNVEVTNIKAKDGTAAATIADSTGIVSLSANPILSGGTANGVLYLNGSKVATSGSALVFDGTNLGVGPATPTAPLSVGSANEFLVYNAMTAFPSSGSDSSVFIARTGSTGSAPFNNAGSLIYRPRVSSDAGRSSHIFYTGSPSAERLRINETGNVGIGTTAPAKLLDLSANNNALAENNTLRFTDTDPSTEANQQIGKLEFYSSDGSSPGASVKAYIGAFAEDTTPDAYLAFATAASSTATERLRIDSAGNVGIGTSSPAVPLDVVSNSGSNGINIRARVSNDYGFLNFKSNDGSDTAGSIAALRAGVNSGSLLFYTGTTEKARLDTSGNLGIGTSSPGTKLSVVGVQASPPTLGTAAGGFSILNNTGVYGTYVGVNPSTGDTWFQAMRNDAATAYNIVLQPSGGNLGLGVTPSAWTTYTALQIKNGSVANYSPTQDFRITANAYYDSGNWKYIASAYALQNIFDGSAGAFRWNVAASGSAGANTTNSTNAAGNEVMTLDASGNLGVGTTSPGARLDIRQSGTTQFYIMSTSATEQNNTIVSFFNNGGSYGNLNYDGAAHIFKTSGTERARITAAGDFAVGDTTASAKVWSYKTDDGNTIGGRNTFATFAATVGFLGADRNTTNNSFYYLDCYNYGAANYRLRIADDGDVTNVNNSYGAISDVKTKQDIVDAASQWDDIKGLRVRKFRYKADPSAPLQIGLVAQEAETVSPGLIDEHPDYEEVEVTDEEGNVKTERQPTGTVTKSVKYSVLYMKSIKALQEAMARIEQLEAKVAALETK